MEESIDFLMRKLAIKSQIQAIAYADPYRKPSQ